MGQLTKSQPLVPALMFSAFALLSSGAPVSAQYAQLGVARTSENEYQWSEIANRLATLGVNYCVMDLKQWRNVAQLAGVRVMLLPNVELVNGLQANLLEEWAVQGGQTIITGPIGILADEEVQDQLKELFGASWQYAFSRPTPLIVESLDTLGTITNPDELTAEIFGGVIQPALEQETQTAAVWLLGNTLPAVITTQNAIFLGWRWGTQRVAAADFDVSWMKVALERYGIRPSGIAPVVETTTPRPCLTNQLQEKPQGPILPTTLKQRQKSPIKPTVNRPELPPTSAVIPIAADSKTVTGPKLIVSPQRSSLSSIDSHPPLEPRQLAQHPPGISYYDIRAMSQELEALIARFESALLTADAGSSGIQHSTGQVVQQFLGNPATSTLTSNASTVTSAALSDSYAQQAIASARQSLQQFLILAERQDYTAAKQQWFQARRTLWQHYPTESLNGQSEIRAMWLDRGTIVKSRSAVGLAKVFDRLAESGINTVFFETLNASYPIYPSRIAPAQNPLVKGWDPLRTAVKLAHERGMELHAWVWTFAAANQRHNLILRQPATYLGPVLSSRPDWALTNRAGQKFHYSSKKAFLDPANPQVKRYLLSLFREIATQYQVDGIHLDYIRYPFQGSKVDQTYGYSPIAGQKFQQLTGVDPKTLTPSHPLWAKWTGFRIEQVNQFVAATSDVLRRQRPELILSTAVFPMPRHQRLTQIQQYWEDWARNNWVDLVVLMTYALDTGNLEEKTRSLFDPSVRGATLFLPGIRLLNVPDPVTVDQLQLLRNMPTGGYALFAAANLTPNLERIFHRTHGRATKETKTPLPYRQPFKAAAIRYQALQQEWNFLIVNRQISLEASTLQAWGNQADHLATALEKLAQDPNPRQISAAQNELIRFRRHFKQWMQVHRRHAPYQVRAWENRLDTLSQLVNYGERVVITRRYMKIAER